MDLITYNTMKANRKYVSRYFAYHPHFCPIQKPIPRRPRPFTTTIITAYDLAVKNGFQGTEKEWLNSLIPVIGENGNWFVSGMDTGIQAVVTKSMDYNDLINKPSINGQLLQGDIDLENISEEFINELFADKINNG